MKAARGLPTRTLLASLFLIAACLSVRPAYAIGERLHTHESGQRFARLVLPDLRDFAILHPWGTARVILQSRGNAVPAILRLRGSIGSDIDGGRLVTAVLPVSAIRRLDAIQGLQSAELDRPLHPELDPSIASMGVNHVWQQHDSGGIPVRGRGALIAIVDSGIDWHNRDFRTSTGTSRIVSLWDQTQRIRQGDVPYGEVCSRQALSDRGSSACREVDDTGHGTAVAAVAASDGLGDPKLALSGVAPEADLVVVKYDGTVAGAIDAFAYVVHEAHLLHRPVVINFSQGENFYPPTDVDPISRAIDALSGPGVAFVVAAGNSGMMPIHASSTVLPGQTAVVDFTNYRDELGGEELTLWYPKNDAFSVSVDNLDDGESYGPVTKGAIGLASTPGGGAAWIDARSMLGRYSLVDIRLTAGIGSLVGNWQLRVHGLKVVDQGPFDVYLPSSDGLSQAFDQPDMANTLDDDASSPEAVAVGASISQSAWVSENGARKLGDLWDCSCRPGTLLPSSSRGDPKNDLKPDVVAPGAAVETDLAPGAHVSASLVTPDRHHFYAVGTSVAAAQVSGVVALLFQLDPALDPMRILNALRASAQPLPGQTAGMWSPGAGYGQIDAAAAAKALQP